MVCFAPHVSSALLVREGLAADQEYGCMDDAGVVPGPFGVDPVPDSRTDAGAAPDPGGSGPRRDSTGSVAVPDPFEDAEALEELEEEITTLAAHIHAATHRLLSLIAEFDRRRGWELGGHRSCAHWLSFCTGFDLGTAREKVRTARESLDMNDGSSGHRGEDPGIRQSAGRSGSRWCRRSRRSWTGRHPAAPDGHDAAHNPDRIPDRAHPD